MSEKTDFKFEAEPIENYEQKCLCVLLLDTSTSMKGNPLSELQKGLETFHTEIKEDPTTSNRLEVALITFDSSIDVKQVPALADNFNMPQLKATGVTHMTEGIHAAIEMVDERKNWYKSTGQPYYRPWIILMTDGAPYPPEANKDLDQLADEIQDKVNDKGFSFFAVGVEGADMNVLKNLSTDNMPPAKLDGLKFAAFFKWLSASMTTVTSSTDGDTVNLPSPGDWMEGFKI
jgi:uncharacterized protein YegL